MVEAIKRYGDTEEKWILRITRLIGRIHTPSQHSCDLPRPRLMVIGVGVNL